MSLCNLTQLVSPNTCLGDSLDTFNSNFSALDDNLCRIPKLIAGNGGDLVSETTEQEFNSLIFSTKNSFFYSNNFDYKNSTAKTEHVLLKDGTTIPTTSFPYISSTELNLPAPYATFSAISLTNKPPKLTLFWTASGAADLTLYATNSSSPGISSPIEFNGPITALLSSGSLLHVGGEFTSVGGVLCKKFCTIDLASGATDGARGEVGSLVGNPLSAIGDLESYGTINVIKEHGDFIIVGGTFQSLAKGRGLTIISKSNNANIYAFYVNGSVHDLEIVDNDLFVAGNFDYINYSAQSVSVISGLRVYTNGLAKINLSRLANFPNSSIDKPFSANVLKMFGYTSINVNSIASRGYTVYIGGLFELISYGSVVAKNIAAIDVSGILVVNWKPIINGEVRALAVDGNYLYAGGKFNSYYLASEYFLKPRPLGYKYEFSNAVAFNVNSTLTPICETNWKPKFNDTVTSFEFHDTDFGSFVYGIGDFTQVGGHQANHIAAVEKSFENINRGEYIVWRNDLQKGPAPINHSIVQFNDTLVVGGNFTSVNGESRSYLARLTKVDNPLSSVSLSAVKWEVGAQLCTPGSNLSLDLTSFITTSAYPAAFGVINQTELELSSDVFKSYSSGDLIRFFIRRPVASDGYYSSAYVLGWKVDFN